MSTEDKMPELLAKKIEEKKCAHYTNPTRNGVYFLMIKRQFLLSVFLYVVFET